MQLCAAGACSAAQRCQDDGTWSSCECISTGAGSGSGATGMITAGMGGGGAGATTGGGAAGVGGVGGADASVGTADAAIDGGSMGDDACPTMPIVYNCSSTCGDRRTCPLTHCGPGPSLPIDLLGLTTSAVLRTPAALPSPDPDCAGKCQSATPTAMLSIAGVGSNVFMKYVVRPPWAISTRVPSSCGADGASCVVTAGNVELVTYEPNAPVRNVLIEKVQEGATCP